MTRCRVGAGSAAVFVAAFLSGCSRPAQRAGDITGVGEPTPAVKREDADPSPQKAVKAVLEAFDHYPVVGLVESHGLEEQRAFIERLVGDPHFPEKVNDIVVEFGNARFQGVMDRYVAGEDVPDVELQRVWREHTCPGPWSSSAYPKYFASFREVNRALPPARRFRVLLGDPPIDWKAIQTRQDFGRFLEQRDGHFARVVEEQVLAKGRKALLIIGGLHLFRLEPWEPENLDSKTFRIPPAGALKRTAEEGQFFLGAQASGSDAGNVAQVIDRKYPGKLFIVLAHDGLGEGSAAVEKRIRQWPIPSVARLKGTWLGAVAANQVMPSPTLQRMYVNGKVVDAPKADPAKGPRLEQVADALLYLGPRATLTWAPDVDYSRDRAFLDELKRRRELTGGPMPPPEKASRLLRRP